MSAELIKYYTSYIVELKAFVDKGYSEKVEMKNYRLLKERLPMSNSEFVGIKREIKQVQNVLAVLKSI